MERFAQNPEINSEKNILSIKTSRRGFFGAAAATVALAAIERSPLKQLGSSSEARETEGFGGGFHAEFLVKTIKEKPVLFVKVYNPGDEVPTGAKGLFFDGKSSLGKMIGFKTFTKVNGEKYLLAKIGIKEEYFDSKKLSMLIYSITNNSRIYTPFAIKEVSQKPRKIELSCVDNSQGFDCGYNASATLEIKPNSFEEGKGYVVVAFPDSSPSSNGFDKSKPVWVGITGKLTKSARLTIMGHYPKASQLGRFANNAFDPNFSQPVETRLNPSFEITKTGGYMLVKY